MENPLRYVKLLPLQGALFATHKNPGRCPGLGASAPSMGVLLWAARVALAALFLLVVLIQKSRNESQIAFPFGQRTLFL